MPEYIGGGITSDSEKEESDLYILFTELSFSQLEALLIRSESRDAKAFYRALLNLKLQIAQEKIVGEELL